MLHQTLISSPTASLLFNVCSSSSSPSLRSHSPRPRSLSKVDMEMECKGGESLFLGSGEEGMESWGVEKLCGVGEGFSVDDLLDLGDFGGDNELESEEFEEQMESEDNKSNNSTSSSLLTFDLPPPPPALIEDIPLPAYDDAADLEWVSRIIDDTISDLPPPPPPPNPTTKVASSTTPTLCSVSTEAPVPVRAKRSKRPASSALWSASFPSPSNSSSSTSSSCLIYSPSGAGAGNAQSCLLYEAPAPPPPAKRPKQKKRGRKPKAHLPPAAAAAAPPVAAGERRCSHCGVQKTPQWRAGPLGAKTLCNACGVRFKSGRLLPEYRPACSPTFESSLHSNSHRKVLEMRRKKDAEFVVVAAAPVASF